MIKIGDKVKLDPNYNRKKYNTITDLTVTGTSDIDEGLRYRLGDKYYHLNGDNNSYFCADDLTVIT